MFDCVPPTTHKYGNNLGKGTAHARKFLARQQVESTAFESMYRERFKGRGGGGTQISTA